MTAASEPRSTSLAPELQDLFARERDLEFRGGLIRVAILGALALALASGIPFALTMQQSGAMAVAPGTLVDVQRYPNERRELGVYAFVDRRGRSREATGSMEPGERRIGDAVDILYSLDDDTFSRPTNISERLLRTFFIGITIFQSTLTLLALGWFWRQRRFRDRLLRDGHAILGSSPRIVERQVPVPNLPRQWRLCVRHFDTQRAQWRDYVSAWRDVPAPSLSADSPVAPTLFDPHDPARYWQPLGGLAQRQPR